MSFYERYEECCKAKGIPPIGKYAAEQLGCTKSSISAFAKSGKTPQGSIVANASKMLNISADYLLDIIDVPNPINLSFNRREIEIINLLKKLNTSEQDITYTFILALASKTIPKYKKEQPALHQNHFTELPVL